MGRCKEYTVYKHTTPNGKVYIGITCQSVNKRWGKNGYKYKNNPYFYSAISKYGWNNIKHEILFTGLTEQEAKSKEIELIAYYKSNQKEFGYNHTIGGDGIVIYGRAPWNKGKSWPESTKKKISESLKGKTHSEETRKKMSKTRKGKPHTKEHSQKIADALKGRPLSESCKQHLSESLKGKTPWNKGKNGYTTSKAKEVSQLSLGGVKICTYRCAGEASKRTGISQGNINSCCNMLRKQAGGYIWRYTDEQD